MNNGFLNIIKPDGITSFQVIAKVRKKLGIKRIGHMGTLDPAGAGVLPLAIGKATKLFDLIQNKTKTYYAIFVFGKITDTLDSFGNLEQIDANTNITIENLQKVLVNFIGKIKQLPPKFSAKKVDGKRAYDLARNGKDFMLEPKDIIIYDIVIQKQIEKNTFLFKIECSSGTYIRSLCRDIAKELKTIAYMPLIIRSAVDDFTLDNGVTLIDFLNSANPADYIISLDKVYPLPMIELTGEGLKKVRNGLPISSTYDDGKYYLLDDKKIFAIGKVSKRELKMEIYLDD